MKDKIFIWFAIIVVVFGFMPTETDAALKRGTYLFSKHVSIWLQKEPC